MTERYIIDDAGTLIDIETRNTYDYVNEVCELLNELATKCSQLKNENEELKQDIRELLNDKLLTELQMKCDKKQGHIVVLENKIRRMRGAIHKLEWLASHRNADLQRENTQLKSENQQIRDTINEMYNNERTALGRSVLKQLMEAIE